MTTTEPATEARAYRAIHQWAIGTATTRKACRGEGRWIARPTGRFQCITCGRGSRERADVCYPLAFDLPEDG